MTENEYIEFFSNIHEVYLNSDLTDEQIQENIKTNDNELEKIENKINQCKLLN